MIRISLTIFMLVLTGCGGSNVIVIGDFPEPLVETLPLHMGVNYSEDFQKYSYKYQKDEKSPEHRIETGATQVKLFDRLFNKFFAEITRLDSLPTEDNPLAVDAIIVPEIEDLQFTSPRDSRSNAFEVWMKYRMNIYSPKGDLVLDWPVSAYGKTPIAFLKTRDKALQKAAVVALRDAGAHFTISFSRLPKLKRWLETQIEQPTQQPDPGAVVAEENLE